MKSTDFHAVMKGISTLKLTGYLDHIRYVASKGRQVTCRSWYARVFCARRSALLLHAEVSLPEVFMQGAHMLLLHAEVGMPERSTKGTSDTHYFPLVRPFQGK
jgi:hypothetical protein